MDNRFVLPLCAQNFAVTKKSAGFEPVRKVVSRKLNDYNET